MLYRIAGHYILSRSLGEEVWSGRGACDACIGSRVGWSGCCVGWFGECDCMDYGLNYYAHASCVFIRPLLINVLSNERGNGMAGDRFINQNNNKAAPWPILAQATA